MPTYNVKYYHAAEDLESARSEAIQAKDEHQAAEMVRENMRNYEKLAVIEWSGLGGRLNSWTVGQEADEVPS